MKKSHFFTALLVGLFVLQSQTVFAAALINQAADLPPGAMSFGNVSKNLAALDPNILAAIIGVVGLLVGSAITILATLLMRSMDIRREDKKERMMMEQNKKEKQYAIKQEVYKNFLHDLAELETFEYKDIEVFKRDWTKAEIKVDLVASEDVREAKHKVKTELLAVAEKNIKNETTTVSDKYLKHRDDLLEAIRQDIDLLQR